MISRPYSTVEFYTTSTPNSVSSYCNNTLVLRVRDSYYKYQSVKRTEAPACPLAQASCTTRTSDSPTRLYVCRIAYSNIKLKKILLTTGATRGFSTIDLYLIFLIYKN
ncbi:hypothetical protein U3516DRAFT_790644 [Neocallimastix sp. 'constans']